MAKLTLLYGVAMELLGIIGYWVTGAKSLTALIPCVFGALAFILGFVALGRPDLTKHAMHAAAVLGLIGFLAPLRVFPAMLLLISGGEVARPAAVVAQAIMLVLSAAFLAACIRSFVVARRARAS
jgi:hypothetical protein